MERGGYTQKGGEEGSSSLLNAYVYILEENNTADSLGLHAGPEECRCLPEIPAQE